MFRKKLLSSSRPAGVISIHHNITIFASQNMREESESTSGAQSINTPHFPFWQDHQSSSVRGLTWVDCVQMPWTVICYQIVSDMRCDLITAATERKNLSSDTDATPLPRCGLFLSSSRDGPDRLRGIFFLSVTHWQTRKFSRSSWHTSQGQEIMKREKDRQTCDNVSQLEDWDALGKHLVANLLSRRSLSEALLLFLSCWQPPDAGFCNIWLGVWETAGLTDAPKQIHIHRNKTSILK